MTNKPIRIGVSMTSSYRGSDSRAIARQMIERAAAARSAGLDSLFLGDHHANPTPYMQNVPMLGRLLAEWGDATAGCLFLLPMWNPVLVAEQVGTLASIAEGLFVVQCSLGYGEESFRAMGTTMKTRPSAFEESLDIVRRLCLGERVSSAGRFRFEDAVVSPRPPDGVSYWIASMSDPSIDRAARLADGWLASPGESVANVIAAGERYRARCAEVGRPVGACAVRRDVFVAGNHEEAERVYATVTSKGYRGFDPANVVCGTVPDVVAEFAALGRAGFTDVLIRHLLDDQELVLASYRRLASVRTELGHRAG